MNDNQKEALKELTVVVSYTLIAATALVFIINFGIAYSGEAKAVTMYFDRFGEANAELVFGSIVGVISLAVLSFNLFKAFSLGKMLVGATA